MIPSVWVTCTSETVKRWSCPTPPCPLSLAGQFQTFLRWNITSIPSMMISSNSVALTFAYGITSKAWQQDAGWLDHKCSAPTQHCWSKIFLTAGAPFSHHSFDYSKGPISVSAVPPADDPFYAIHILNKEDEDAAWRLLDLNCRRRAKAKSPVQFRVVRGAYITVCKGKFSQLHLQYRWISFPPRENITYHCHINSISALLCRGPRVSHLV